MYCTNCGKKIPDNAQVCDGCGWSSRPSSAFQRPADLDSTPVYKQPAQPTYQQPVYQQSTPVNPAPVAAPQRRVKKENIPLGILGALGGAILGGASIILFSQMMWLSDFRYASEGADYADVLLTYPVQWWLGLGAMILIGVLLVWRFPVGHIFWARRTAAGWMW